MRNVIKRITSETLHRSNEKKNGQAIERVDDKNKNQRRRRSSRISRFCDISNRDRTDDYRTRACEGQAERTTAAEEVPSRRRLRR